MEKILSRNPKDGSILSEITKTPLSDLPQIFKKATQAQKMWAQVPVKKRARKLLHLREVLAKRADELADLIHAENGKPKIEAMTTEIIPCLELLGFFSSVAHKQLRRKSIHFRNPAFWYRKSYIDYVPMGVIGVISPWNFPLLLAFGDIAVAILTGNAVVFKPSEYTAQVGQFIQALFDEAGFPPNILQTIQGEGDLGAALIENKPAKICFTGSVATGKRVMKAAADHLIPVTLELGGKDAMIILPDADLDYASSVALWGGFANSGQACASTERLLVHESVAKNFTERLKEKIALLSADSDLGVITMDKQKQVYEAHLKDAKERNLKMVCGGILTEDRTRMLPTLVAGENVEDSLVYNEETFGPVIAMTTFKTVPEAIEKVNKSPYGLLASVITSSMGIAEDIAKELQVGSVMINEVLYSAGLAETPWGGRKDSGFGKKHSLDGIYEFVHGLHVNRPRFGFLTFKSFWWFPYTELQYDFFRSWVRMYEGGFVERFLNLPHFLAAAIRFLKTDRRV